MRTLLILALCSAAVAQPLPQSLPDIEVAVHAEGSVEPGIVLMSVRRSNRDGMNADFSTQFGLIIGISNSGEVVWQYHADHRISDIEVLRSGNIAYLTADHRLVEINKQGEIVGQWSPKGRPYGVGEGIQVEGISFHHEIDELPNGNFVVMACDLRELKNYWSNEKDQNAPKSTQQVMGDEILEFTREGKVVWRWSTFDHLDPMRIGINTFSNYWPARGFPDAVDWTHGNAVHYIEEDDAYLMSFRFQDSIIKVSRKTKEIEWILGEDVSWSNELKTKVLKPEGEVLFPWHGHAPTMTTDGRILYFNNVNVYGRPFEERDGKPDMYGRVVAYRVDEKAMTVRQVWESDQNDAAVRRVPAMGDVRHQPETGNILAFYGFNMPLKGRPDGRMIAAREFTGDAKAEKVWEVWLTPQEGDRGVRWNTYGGVRVPEEWLE